MARSSIVDERISMRGRERGGTVGRERYPNCSQTRACQSLSMATSHLTNQTCTTATRPGFPPNANTCRIRSEQTRPLRSQLCRIPRPTLNLAAPWHKELSPRAPRPEKEDLELENRRPDVNLSKEVAQNARTTSSRRGLGSTKHSKHGLET